MKIYETYYNVTDFEKIHPGGSVIKHYRNADATHVFNNFHYRSKKAKFVLQSLPTIDPKDAESTMSNYKQYSHPNTSLDHHNNEEMMKDFENWRISLIDRGFFKPDWRNLAFQFVDIFILYCTSTLLFYHGWKIFGSMFLSEIGSGIPC